MRRNALGIAVMIFLLLPALAFGMASFDFPAVAPVVTFVAGDVTIKGAGSSAWDKAEEGRLLSSGDTVRTGPSSKAEITCATGKMRLYENTVVIVPEVIDEGDKKDVRAVTLDDGASLFRIRKRGAEKGFEVQTSNIIAGVKGTLFGVQTVKERKISRVAVYSGKVYVTDHLRTPSTGTTLGKGQSMEVEEDSGFGDSEDFNPSDIWKQWKKQRNPSPLSIGLSAPSSRTSLRQWIEEDEEGEVSCPPVVDNDGNVVVP